ncbi:MAG: RNA polymerase sigma factor [Lachnospiraceae bacterium]|nr:RNA polymerase sigma factor [Lachnospiraceae bacterium]
MVLPGKQMEIMAQEPDLEGILSGVARRETASFAKLYQLVSGKVYGFALSMLRNKEDAEDVLHDCFLAVYEAADRYESREKPMAWILTITRNLCRMKLRERTRTSDLPEEDWEAFLSSREGLSHEDRILLKASLTELTAEEQQIVLLHAVWGFKHREIAKILALPVSTVLSKYHRSIGKLRARLEKGEVG